MKIQSQLTYNYQPTKSFGSNARVVKDSAKKIVYRNHTWFFRRDLSWNKFCDMLIERYKDVDKVNVYDYACSEGAEPFSLAMMLIKKLGDKAQKFFPIMASDIDPVILKNPKNGIIRPSVDDMENIRDYVEDDYLKFFKIDQPLKRDAELNSKLYAGYIEPVLKKAVKFEEKDITKDILNVKKDNSVIICRNLWPYLSEESREELSKNIAKQIGNNSICLIGRYDTEGSDVETLMEDQGLRMLDLFKTSPCYTTTSNIPKENYPHNYMNLMMTFKKAKSGF